MVEQGLDQRAAESLNDSSKLVQKALQLNTTANSIYFNFCF